MSATDISRQTKKPKQLTIIKRITFTASENFALPAQSVWQHVKWLDVSLGDASAR